MDKTFSMVPASSVPLIVMVAISVLLLLLLGLFAFIGYSSRHVTFELSDEGLRIKGGFYGRFIPKEDIPAEDVKIIDFTTFPEYKPRIRTNGIGLPGYAAGWFKLKNDEKALLFVTDQSSMVYIPTKRDFSVILSVSNSEEFYESMKQWE